MESDPIDYTLGVAYLLKHVPSTVVARACFLSPATVRVWLEGKRFPKASGRFGLRKLFLQYLNPHEMEAIGMTAEDIRVYSMARKVVDDIVGEICLEDIYRDKKASGSRPLAGEGGKRDAGRDWSIDQRTVEDARHTSINHWTPRTRYLRQDDPE